MKKIISLILTIVLLMSICVSAFADYNTLKPGKSIAQKYNISADPVISITAAGRAGDKIKVQLDIWDEYVQSSKPDDHWKKSFERTTFTINSGAIYLTIKPKKFHYVNSKRTPQARLRIWAVSTNKDMVDVSYTKK